MGIYFILWGKCHRIAGLILQVHGGAVVATDKDVPVGGNCKVVHEQAGTHFVRASVCRDFHGINIDDAVAQQFTVGRQMAYNAYVTVLIDSGIYVRRCARAVYDCQRMGQHISRVFDRINLSLAEFY